MFFRPAPEARPLRQQRDAGDGLQVDDLAARDHVFDLLQRERVGFDVAFFLVRLRIVVVLARLAQAAETVEVHLLVAVAGRREQRAEPFESLRDEADLLVALAHRRFTRVLARLERACRQFPDPPGDRRPVLFHKDDLPIVGHRNQHHRARMPDDVRVHLLAAGERQRLYLQREDLSFVHLADLSRDDRLIHRHPSSLGGLRARS